MMKELVITGMGAVTPVGVGVDAYWEGLLSGKCGIGEIEGFAHDALPIHRAAQVRGMNPKDYLPTRLVMDLEPYMQYAYIAALEALEDSGLPDGGDRTGIVMGTALHGVDIIARTQETIDKMGKSASPKLLTKSMGNITAAHFSIDHGFRGPSMTVSTACSSGGDAITLAALMLRADMADAMVVLAGEAAICPSVIQSLYKTGALSKEGESRPFDAGRSGFVMGEGGGALVLETREHAEARGARVRARLLGCGNNSDAHHPVSPSANGGGAADCIRLARAEAGLEPDAVDCIKAHSTATHRGDAAEAAAIHSVFGGRDVAVSSTKGATGHMMGAGGITEVIACVKAIETGLIPPCTGFETADEECRLNLITSDNRRDVRVALSNAMGFGGQNSCVIVGRTED